MKKIILSSIVASSVLMANGYKIPEASTNAVALGAANIAHNQNNADSAYYNPANMVFMSNQNHVEADLMYIGLDKVKFEGSGAYTGVNEESEQENFIIPSLHYVSGQLGDKARVGVSIVAPAGLSKRWEGTVGSKSAEEFTLEVIEINPTAAFKVSETVGIALGFRVLHTSGVVKVTPSANPAFPVYQDMTGDSVDFGYNLALAYKPTSNIEVGVTYRSQVDLSVEGTAELSHPTYAISGDYDVSVTLPIPAVFSVAAAYTFPSKTTLELVYEKNYWSAYKDLDFDYEDATAEAVFGGKTAKDWEDTDTFRIGLTQEFDTFTIMAGLVIDESPTPEKTVGFELPDSPSTAVSLGGRYKINESVDVGMSALYSMRESRTVEAANSDKGLDGEFSEGNVLIVSMGVGYKF